MAPFLKVCCIASIEEMQLAVRHGADAIGLVSDMPSGPGPISDHLIREIARQTPPPVMPVMLTSRSTGRDIADHILFTRVPAVQIVRQIDPHHYDFIRSRVPGVKLIQVVHVAGEESLEHAREYGQYSDALLLDSGQAGASATVLGGTGKAHDWRISRKIVEGCEIPVFLAGGLKPENLEQALAEVRPYGIDACSGFRTNDMLDKDKLAAATAILRDSWQDL